MMIVYTFPAWLPSLGGVLNHAWQSTLFAAVAALLALALRKNQARWRCRLWLAASIKFFVPFSVLIRLGSQSGWRAPRLPAQAGLSLVMEGFSQPFARPLLHQAFMAAPPLAFSMVPVVLLAVWLCGCAAVLFRWWLNWRRIHAAVRAAAPMLEGRELKALRRVELIAGMRRPIRLCSSAVQLEPGIFGIFRAVLLWPAGFAERLADAQLTAIMTHEVCHARRRDNLAAAIHMLVEAVFWFHPLVWWLGARLVEERENACDEEVLRLGSEPQVYAEGILKTCQFCLEPPSVCMAGVTGSDLRKRMERIMTYRIGRRLDFGRALLLAAATIAAMAGPFVFGVVSAPAVRAQSQPAVTPKFEVASIKPNTSGDHRIGIHIAPGGRFTGTNVSAQMLITIAYDLKPHQLSGGPGWLDSVKYDVNAKAEGAADRDALKLMVQSLLADRFKLVFHRDTKEMPVYTLAAGKSAPKLTASEAVGENKSQFRLGRGQLDLQSATMAQLADALSNLLGRTVLDRTGINGSFDIKMAWTPDENEGPMFRGPGDGSGGAPVSDAAGPSVFAAIQEQLGLKLEASKGPVEILVIDHIAQATEN